MEEDYVPTPEELYTKGITIAETLIESKKPAKDIDITNEVVNSFGYSGLNKKEVEAVVAHTLKVVHREWGYA